MHCHRYTPLPISRRELLKNGAHGIGAVALASLLQDRSFGASVGPVGSGQVPHHAPTAKNVIFLYMDGGPSHVDTFDHKPMLAKYSGQNAAEVMGKLEPTQFDNIGKVMKSPWEFRQYGESGHWEFWNGKYNANLWGGTLCQNLTQALARLAMTDPMMAIDRWLTNTYGGDSRIVHTVHDELLALAPDEHAQHVLATMIERMCENPPWADHRLVLAAEGGFAREYSK